MHPETTRLADKYRPQRLEEIVGQSAVSLRLAEFLACPHSAAFLFSGPPGVGKTSCGIIIANELHVNPTVGHWDYDAAKMDADDMDYLESVLRYSPMGGGWRVVRIEEADWLCKCPKLAARWKTLLDHLPTRTVFVFTTNHPDKFSDAFMRRVEHLPFASDCDTLAPDAQELASRIWFAETGRWEDCPNVADLDICVNGAIQFSAVPMALQSRLRPVPVAAPRFDIERRKSPASVKAATLRELARYLVTRSTCPTRAAIEARFGIPWHQARTTVMRRFPRGPEPASPIVPIADPVPSPSFDWNDLADLTLSGSI